MRRLVAVAPLLAVIAVLSAGPFCAFALAAPGGSAADSQYFDPLRSGSPPASHTRTVKPVADRSASTDPAEPIAIAVGGIGLITAFSCGIVIGRRRRHT